MSTVQTTIFLLANAASAYAQYGGSPTYGHQSNGGGDPDSSPSPSDGQESYFDLNREKFITAHAVIATVTMGLLLPLGAIMVRLASSPKTWLIHGLFQTAAYAFFITAVGLGVYIAKKLDLLHNKHPVIGLILLGLISFQPALGYIHHRSFVKSGHRVAVSHIHIWLGRAIITLGMINGGFGLQLTDASMSQIIGYSVVVGLVWLVYVASSITGETRRRKVTSPKAEVKDERDMYETGRQQATQ